MDKQRSYYETTGKMITAQIGIHKGYNHNNDTLGNISDEEKYKNFVELISQIAEMYYQKYNIYVSFVVQPARVIYRNEWGCPPYGEEVFTVETSPDPEYYDTRKKVNDYIEGAITIIRVLSNSLKQSTVRINIVDDVKIIKKVFDTQ